MSDGEGVRWEILKGLPGEGAFPQQYDLGHPTPWAEGFVVRFWSDRIEWIGNFQRGWMGSPEVLGWPEANRVVVIASGGFYMVDCRDPANYVTLGSENDVSCTLFSEDRKQLFVGERFQVIRYRPSGNPLWKSGWLGGEVLSVRTMSDALIVDVEEELDERFAIVRLSAADGKSLE